MVCEKININNNLEIFFLLLALLHILINCYDISECKGAINLAPKTGSSHGISFTEDEPPHAVVTNKAGNVPLKKVAGLSQEPYSVSFESMNNPGWFLRVYTDNNVYLESRDSARNTSTFTEDATFSVVQDRFSTGYRAFESASRRGMYLTSNKINEQMTVTEVRADSKAALKNRASFKTDCIKCK